jgi:hypothetical protein
VQSAYNGLNVLCVCSHLVVQTYEPPNGVVAVMRRETVEATKGEETVEQQARPVYESCDSHLRTRSDRQP